MVQGQINKPTSPLQIDINNDIELLLKWFCSTGSGYRVIILLSSLRKEYLNIAIHLPDIIGKLNVVATAIQRS